MALHRSPEFMASCICICWKLAKPSVDIHVFLTDHIHLLATKTISTKRFGILINNLIDLSYMTTCRSPVGQSKEEYKGQESIHDAAWHCPV